MRLLLGPMTFHFDTCTLPFNFRRQPFTSSLSPQCSFIDYRLSHELRTFARMLPRGCDLLDSSIYSELYSTQDSHPTLHQIPTQILPAYLVPMPSPLPPPQNRQDSLQRRQPVLPSIAPSHRYTSQPAVVEQAPALQPLTPHSSYLPPPQQIPLSFTDNEYEGMEGSVQPHSSLPIPRLFYNIHGDPLSHARHYAGADGQPIFLMQAVPIPQDNQIIPPFQMTAPQTPKANRVLEPIYSTPVTQRISSKRLPGDDRRMLVRELGSSLHFELKNNVCQCDSLVESLYNRLPFPVDDSLLAELSKAGIWDMDHAYFTFLPKSSSESDMESWLNRMGYEIGQPSGHRRLRLWSASCRDKPPSGSNIIRKPDLVLIDRETYKSVRAKVNPSHVEWTDIRAFGEVSSEHPIPRRMFDTVNQKSYLMFLCQCNRRFVPALSFDGDGYFSLTVTDRQGQVRMGVISITAAGKRSALCLLKVLACLMYGTSGDVGLDASMSTGDNGDIDAITVKGHQFSVDRLIYRLQSLIGRGTQVWVVKKNHKRYILKDSWVQSGRVGSEIDFLQLMAKHKFLEGRVPKIIAGEDVVINGFLDSTERYRLDVGLANYHRIHRRHVTEPIGEPLVKVQSRAEFLQVMIEVVEGKSFLPSFDNIV